MKGLGRYLSTRPYRGKRKARREVGEWMRTRAMATFGRRPGRLQKINDRCQGHLDEINSPKAGEICRVYFQNVGTLRLGSEAQETGEAMRIMKELDIDVAGLSEINKNMDHPTVQRRYKYLIKKEMRGSEVAMAHNKDYVVRGQNKPGGIMLLRSARMKSLGSTEEDEQGRWVKTEITVEDLTVSVYTVYVPSDVGLGGPSTVRRQLMMSTEQRMPGAQWKTKMYDDLVTEVNRDKDMGKEVLIGGDFNESIEKRGMMRRRMEEMGLTNVLGARVEKIPATRVPGRLAIDHIWGSEGVMARITRSGIVQRDEIFISDHHGIFVDINVGEIPELELERDRRPRYLKSGNKRNKEKYLDYTKGRFEEEKIWKKVEHLRTKLQAGDTGDRFEKSLNNVDMKVQEILLSGEKKLKPPGNETRSKELSGYKRERRYWRMIRKTSGTVTHYRLTKVWEGHRPSNWNLSDRDMRVRLREVEGKIKKYYSKKMERREKYLEEKAEDYGKDKNGNMEKCVKEILKREKRRRETAMMRATVGDSRSSVDLEVEVPRGTRDVKTMWDEIKGDGPVPEVWERVKDQKEAEALMTEWCKEHFSQASETPLTKGKWKKELDLLEDGDTVAKLLAGEYKNFEGQHKEVAQWLEECKRKGGVTNEVKLEVSWEDFKHFAEKVLEFKGSSPSGRHYGHYKVLAEEESLLRVLYDIIDMALKTGIVLQRWRRVHQMLLLKDPPGCRIHRFRNITLVEGDLMFVMKKVWAKNLGNQIHTEGTLDEAQYARMKQVPHVSVLNKRISYDLQHVLREESFQADNDALSCYDRIIDDVAGISAMRLGLSRQSARYMKAVLTSMKHKILIGGKPSEYEFTSSLRERLHGTGQGTGWSPVLWSVVNDVIITLMREHQPGQVFISPDGNEVARQAVDAYVDDSNLAVNQSGVDEFNERNGTNSSLEEGSRESFQGYERYLFTSGGKLALPKCKFYWLHFNRKKTKYKYGRKKRMTFNIKLGFTRKEVNIKQIDARKEHKILGIWLSPAAVTKRQREDIKKKVTAWCQKMEAARIPGFLKIESYKKRLWAQVSYSLGIAQLKKEELKKLMGPAERVVKNALYLGSTFSNAILRLPGKFGGYGVKDTYTFMVCEQAKMIVSSMRKSDNTGGKIRILVAYHQLECGSTESILERLARGDDTTLTETWLVNALRNLRKLGLGVRAEHWTPGGMGGTTIREQMEESGISGEYLERMNLCRMRLGLIFVDDLYTLTGKLMTKDDREWRQSTSTLRWPKTEIPEKWFDQWDNMTEEVFPAKKKELVWRFRKGLAYKTEDGKVVKYNGTYYEREAGRSRLYKETDQIDCNPTHECEVREKKDGTLEVRGSMRPKLGTVKEEERTPRIPLGSAEVQMLTRMLRDGTLEGASDGSVKDGKKTVAVWLGSRTSPGKVMLSREVVGLPNDSGRAELEGPLLALETLRDIEEANGTIGQVTLWCDSQEVVDEFEQPKLSMLPSGCCKRNTDMLLRKEHLVNRGGSRLTVKKVKGHQDDREKYENLLFQEQRNVDCDHEAECAMSGARGENYIKKIPEGVKAMVWTSRGGLTVEPYDWIMEEGAKCVVQKRLRCNERAFELIDWEVHGKSMKKIQPRYRASVLRMVWDELPTQEKMKRNKYIDDDKCPLCRERDEAGHYLRCRGTDLRIQRERLIGNLRSDLRKWGVSPVIGTWILQALRGETPKLHDLSPLRLNQAARKAYADQNTIGWRHLAKGRPAKSLTRLQQVWDSIYPETKKNPREKQEEMLAKCLGMCLLAGYEIWKERSKEVLKVEPPTRKKALLNMISELKEMGNRVEARDRFLLEPKKMPGSSDSIQEMKDWIRCVQASIKRADRMIQVRR